MRNKTARRLRKEALENAPQNVYEKPYYPLSAIRKGQLSISFNPPASNPMKNHIRRYRREWRK